MNKRIVYELIWEKYGQKEFSLKDVLIVIGILILKVTGMSDSEFQAYLMAVNIKQSTERIPGLANGDMNPETENQKCWLMVSGK